VEIPEYPDPFSGSQYSGLPSWGRPEAQIDVYYVKGTSHEVVSLCEQYLSTLDWQTSLGCMNGSARIP